MTNSPLKAEVLELLEQLPEDATWEDVIYEMYVHQRIEAGLADAAANRGATLEEVKKRFGVIP